MCPGLTARLGHIARSARDQSVRSDEHGPNSSSFDPAANDPKRTFRIVRSDGEAKPVSEIEGQAMCLDRSLAIPMEEHAWSKGADPDELVAPGAEPEGDQLSMHDVVISDVSRMSGQVVVPDSDSGVVEGNITSATSPRSWAHCSPISRPI